MEEGRWTSHSKGIGGFKWGQISRRDQVLQSMWLRPLLIDICRITEARDENKADDEEFENDGKSEMAKSKIKTRDLKWVDG